MKFNKRWLWLIIPLIIFSLVWMNSSSVSTVLLAIKGTIIDGNLIKFSGTVGVAEDAGVAASNVTKNKFDATSPPTVNNDVDEGYTVGSKWCDVTADRSWVCLDNTNGVAVWMETTADWTFTHLEDQLFFGEFARIEYVKYSKFDATSAPTVNDDVNLGYVIGSLWYDITVDLGYVCLDNAGGVAVWIETTSLGHTNLTSFVDQTAWRLFYSNADGDVIELALGTDGKYLMSNGLAVAPTWELVAGETNTASNVGGHIEIYKQKTGVDLEFRTLKAESNQITISITPASIDVGVDPSAGDGGWTCQTLIDKANPANASGTLTKVDIWANITMSNCEVATFYNVSGNNFTTRDWETIGTVTAGSKQTFDVTLDVVEGDYIGLYYTDGKVAVNYTGSGNWYGGIGNDYIPCTNQTFSSQDSYEFMIYGRTTADPLDFIKFDIVEGNIKLDDLGAPDDNTDNDASTTAHGLLRKLDDDDTHYLDGKGAWTVPAGEANTASNIGFVDDETTAKIYKQKTGVDLELRVLKEGTAVDFIWVSDSGLKENNTQYAALRDDLYGVYMHGQYWTAGSDYTIDNIQLLLYKMGTGNSVTIYVYAADASGYPTGDLLGSKTVDCTGITTDTAGEWVTFDLSTDNITITSGNKFCFYGMGTGDSGNCTGFKYKDSDVLADSYYIWGTNSTWYNVATYDRTFKIYASASYHNYVEIGVVPSEIAKDIGGLLSTTTVAFNADADTTLYTVPTGKRCVLSHAIVVAAGDAGGTTTVSIGANGAETDFVPANTLSNLDAEYDSVILMPIPNTTPLKIKSYAAATVIEAQVANQSGAAGNTIYLFGILY